MAGSLKICTFSCFKNFKTCFYRGRTAAISVPTSTTLAGLKPFSGRISICKYPEFLIRSAEQILSSVERVDFQPSQAASAT
jgi:hypothetical protein